MHDLNSNGVKEISGVHPDNDAVLGVFNCGGEILSISDKGQILFWQDPSTKRELHNSKEPITHCAAMPSKVTPGLLEVVIATYRGEIRIFNLNKPVMGEAGNIQDFTFHNTPSFPIIADCGFTSVGDKNLIYAATGKGQLGLYSF